MTTAIREDGRSFEATELPLTLPLVSGGVCLRLDGNGMVPAGNQLGAGLYFNDTRHLSAAKWTIGGKPLRLLPAKQRGGHSATFRYGNTSFSANGEDIPAHHLRIRRNLVIHDGSLYEEVSVHNSHSGPVVVELAYEAEMDAAHMFHVRGFGFDPDSRGCIHEAAMARTKNAPAVVFRYEARNGLWVHTVIEFLARRANLVQMPGSGELRPLTGACRLTYRFALKPGKTKTAELRITPIPVRDKPLVENLNLTTSAMGTPDLPLIDDIKGEDAPWSFSMGLQRAEDAYGRWRASQARITTSNPAFNRLLAISQKDLFTLWLNTSTGSTWAAGAPWYLCPFGRDSAIVAEQASVLAPDQVRDVILFHAAHLGTRYDPRRAQFPGKAFHEKRGGELAWLGKIVHGSEPYYGSVDGTPLFLRLFANYVVNSGDLDFARQLWPQIEAALIYIGSELERGEGWLVYGLDPDQALHHQGWKDSNHGIRRSDGSPSRHPIALVEVQAYLYEALIKLARVCDALGANSNGQSGDYSGHAAKSAQSEQLRKLAAELRRRFLEKFVTADGGFLALGLDAQGPDGVSQSAVHQILTVTTNAGHVLSTGILPPDLAASVANRLGQQDMLHRWGLVATASSTRGWNPEAYHDGIWTWDNSEVVKGLCTVGATELAHLVVERQLALVRHTPDGRLPELVCGYNSKRHRPWPQACVPQAWSAGAAFQWLTSLLGLNPNGLDGVLEIDRPSLPPWLNWVRIDNLRVGQNTLDVRFESQDGVVVAEFTRNPSGVPGLGRRCAIKTPSPA